MKGDTAMYLSFFLPFLILFALIFCTGSLYLAIANVLRSRPPKRTEYTSVSFINFQKNSHFSS